MQSIVLRVMFMQSQVVTPLSTKILMTRSHIANIMMSNICNGNIYSRVDIPSVRMAYMLPDINVTAKAIPHDRFGSDESLTASRKDRRTW